MKHPSAEDIQEYLDGISGPDKRALKIHFQDCAACRARLEEYRKLYAGLADGRAIADIGDLPDKVMERIAGGPDPEVDSALKDVLLAGCGVLLAAAALILFVGIGPLAAGLAGLAGSMRDLATRGTAGVHPPVIAAAAAVIVLVYLANGIALRRAGSRSRRP